MALSLMIDSMYLKKLIMLSLFILIGLTRILIHFSFWKDEEDKMGWGIYENHSYVR